MGLMKVVGILLLILLIAIGGLVLVIVMINFIKENIGNIGETIREGIRCQLKCFIKDLFGRECIC